MESFYQYCVNRERAKVNRWLVQDRWPEVWTKCGYLYM